MKPKLFIDMDDTICIYRDRFISESIRTGLKYPQSQKGFYLELEPISGAISSIWQLNEIYDIWFLTRPSYMNPECYTEKRLWIEKHFDLEWCKKLILCPDKSLIKGEGNYLVDDYDWPGFEGEQILFGSREYPNWSVVRNKLISDEIRK